MRRVPGHGTPHKHDDTPVLASRPHAAWPQRSPDRRLAAAHCGRLPKQAAAAVMSPPSHAGRSWQGAAALGTTIALADGIGTMETSCVAMTVCAPKCVQKTQAFEGAKEDESVQQKWHPIDLEGNKARSLEAWQAKEQATAGGEEHAIAELVQLTSRHGAGSE